MTTKTTSNINKNAPVVVIGAGPGGYPCAIRLAQQGKQVILVDKHALGGTCLNWGCIPSKALIHASHQYHQLQHASQTLNPLGIRLASPPTLDWSQTLAWKDGLIKQLQGGIAHLLKKHKVTFIQGMATLHMNNQVHVQHNDGSEQWIAASHVVLATGAEAMTLPAWPCDGHRVFNAQQWLNATDAPTRKHWLVVGAGVIGLELGNILLNLGCDVTWVDASDTLLPQQDSFMVQELCKQLEALGGRFHLGVFASPEALPVAGEDTPINVTFTAALKEATPTPLPKPLAVDAVLVATGRTANLNAVGLPLLQPRLSDNQRTLWIDATGQTSLPNVYAVGDLTEGSQLAHRATYQAGIVADAIAGIPRPWDAVAVPSVIYTAPELASVGFTLAEAEARGLAVHQRRFSLNHLGRSYTQLANKQPAFVQLVALKETNVLVGAQLLGTHVSELLGELTLAIESGLSAHDVALTLHAHPSLYEGVWEAAEGLLGHALHG